jgi:ABC-2 type transport system ATP-binding protein
MRQRLGLAAALLGEPRLLVLDEPANGLDPAGKRQVHQVLTDLAAAGATVILSSHRMDDLAALCDEVTLLATGRVVFSGPVSKLAAEGGDVAYRVVVVGPEGAREEIRTTEADLDEVIARLVATGSSIRDLGPVVPPLEAAFLALTGADEEDER